MSNRQFARMASGGTPSVAIRDRIDSRWLCRLGFTVSAMLWMGLIFYLSSLSQREVETLQPLPSGASSWVNVLRQVAGHLFLYAVLAALLHASLWSWKGGAARRLQWAMAIAALAALYGVSDELHQSTVTGRSAPTMDALVNLAGAVMAVGTISYLAKTLFKVKAMHPGESAVEAGP